MIDPLGGALQFGIVADGGFVHHAMALAFSPLGAPFFVAEGGHQAEGEKDPRPAPRRRLLRSRFSTRCLSAVSLAGDRRWGPRVRRLWVTVQRPA